MKDITKILFNKETISYIFFGVLTTIVNYATFIGSLKISGGQNPLTSNLIAFVFASTFAYVTNKIWVFNSKSWSLKTLKIEILSFFSARVTSFILEQGCLFFAISVIDVGQYSIFNINGIIVTKVGLSFAVVLLNYIISKLLVFK